MCHLTALVGQPLGEETLCDRDTVEFLSGSPSAMVWGCLGRLQHIPIWEQIPIMKHVFSTSVSLCWWPSPGEAGLFPR